MDSFVKTSLWEQFGAAIYVLKDAIRTCPDEMWLSRIEQEIPGYPDAGRFWRVAYHGLFYLDLYLSGTVEGFAPPAPFGITKSYESETLPDRAYTKQGVLMYADHCRKKCQSTIQAMTDESARKQCVFPWLELSFFELQLYSMRHIQEHGAQLNLFLGQNNIEVFGWVGQASERETNRQV